MKYDRYKHLSERPLSSPGFGGSFLTIVAALGRMISKLRTSWKPAARVRDTGQQETKQCHLSNRQHNLHRAIRLDDFGLALSRSKSSHNSKADHDRRKMQVSG
jgi:hypothetical protein